MVPWGTHAAGECLVAPAPHPLHVRVLQFPCAQQSHSVSPGACLKVPRNAHRGLAPAKDPAQYGVPMPGEKRLFKIDSWYDNEWGYSNCVNLLKHQKQSWREAGARRAQGCGIKTTNWVPLQEGGGPGRGVMGS